MSAVTPSVVCRSTTRNLRGLSNINTSGTYRGMARVFELEGEQAAARIGMKYLGPTDGGLVVLLRIEPWTSFVKSLSHYESALQIKVQATDSSHVDVHATVSRLDAGVGRCYTDMADCFVRDGDFKSALGMYESVLRLKMQSAGPTHPSTLETRQKKEACQAAMASQ
jgi:pentatricopeptide repeat protein